MSPQTSAYPFGDYLRLYLSSPKELLELTNAAATPIAQGMQTRTVLTTWEISFDVISQRSPMASEMLIMCGMLSRNHINHAYFSNLFSLQHKSSNSEQDSNSTNMFSG